MTFQPISPLTVDLASVKKSLTDRATTVLANDAREAANVDGVQLTGAPESKKKSHRKSSSSKSSRSRSTQKAASVVTTPEPSALDKARAKFYASLTELGQSSPAAKQFLEDTKKALVEDTKMSGEQKEVVLAQHVMVFASDTIGQIDEALKGQTLTPEQDQALRAQAEPVAKAGLAANAMMQNYTVPAQPSNSQSLNFESAQPGAELGSQPPLATPQSPDPQPPVDPNKEQQDKDAKAKEAADADQAERDAVKKIMDQMWEDRKKWQLDMLKMIQETNKQIFEMWQAINQSRQESIQKGIDTFNDYLNTW